MAPPKSSTTKKSTVITSDSENQRVKTMNTRNSRGLSNSSVNKIGMKNTATFAKRKAVSPIKGNTLKRSALGNITNAVEKDCIDKQTGKKVVKKAISSTVTKSTIATAAKTSMAITTLTKPAMAAAAVKQASPMKNSLPPLPKSRLTIPLRGRVGINKPSVVVSSSCVKPQTSTSATALTNKPVASTASQPAVPKKPAPTMVPASKCKITAKPKCMVHTVPNSRRSSGRRSTLDSTDSSLYVSALSDTLGEETPSTSKELEPFILPPPDINIDVEYANDPYQCATYVQEIFEYLKTREDKFRIPDYMEKQPSLSQEVRAVLVDWMVEVQETLEMNHETLYLGVKLMDTYLSRIKVARVSLQLVGAVAMLISAKYDERIPAAIDDFLYLCDGSYKRKDFTKMEVNMLRVINFELGFPLSYRFLRRYARCAKVQMPLLTLARYILENALMDYSTVSLSDSKMAAAALYLAFKMKKELQWDNTLIHFSGYQIKDFVEEARILNDSLHQKPKVNLQTVKNKYSHSIFYEVAKTPMINNEEL